MKKTKNSSIGTFSSKSGLRYDGHFFEDTQAFALMGPMMNNMGSAATAFEGAAETKEDAKRQIEEAIENGLLK